MANTKLLLLEDVENLGRSGDIVTAKPGFARNFLVPKGHALPATKQALRRQAMLQEERAKKAAADKADAEVVAKKLLAAVLETKVKVDPEGHMYGSVSSLDVVQMIEEQLKFTVDRHHIDMEHPIKETGIHKVAFKLPEGVAAEVTVKVLSESADAGEIVAEIEEESSQEQQEEEG